MKVLQTGRKPSEFNEHIQRVSGDVFSVACDLAEYFIYQSQGTFFHYDQYNLILKVPLCLYWSVIFKCRTFNSQRFIFTMKHWYPFAKNAASCISFVSHFIFYPLQLMLSSLHFTFFRSPVCSALLQIWSRAEQSRAAVIMVSDFRLWRAIPCPVHFFHP